MPKDWPHKFKAPHLITGKNAEKIAFKYLAQQGLKLVEKNYSCRYGEIDLIMRDKQSLVFIEVRYRQSTDFGLPEETVTVSKQSKIIKSAQSFLLEKKYFELYPVRFDIVAITGKVSNYKVYCGTIPEHKINWITDAFYAQA